MIFLAAQPKFQPTASGVGTQREKLKSVMAGKGSEPAPLGR